MRCFGMEADGMGTFMNAVTFISGEDHYLADVEECEEISTVVTRINDNLASNAVLCREFMVKPLPYDCDIHIRLRFALVALGRQKGQERQEEFDSNTALSCTFGICEILLNDGRQQDDKTGMDIINVYIPWWGRGGGGL